ncbi:MAG TPA: hypothetical protein O0X39_04150 [Methanocorpusculum sp.]|nr:hypothetical protein [Methanocorpusculum sp.]
MYVMNIKISKENKYERMGNLFEETIASKFSSKYFTIVTWTTDRCRDTNIRVESDKNPDFRIRYEPTKEEFAVECKFRTWFYEEINPYGEIVKQSIQWAKPEQMERYKKYEKEQKIPVFIVIGVGGKPNNPQFIFCIPLKEIKYPEIYGSIFERNEKNPETNFFWDPKTKKLS